METIKNIIEEKTAHIKEYNAILDRLETLKIALLDYDKNIINKTFFEKYFTRKDEAGAVVKDWKNRIVTDYKFTDPAYSFQKDVDGLIFLAHSEYLEVSGKDKKTVLEAVNSKIDIVAGWINNANNSVKEAKNTNERAIIDDLKAVYKKHNNPSFWGKILDLYEVKYPNN